MTSGAEPSTSAGEGGGPSSGGSSARSAFFAAAIVTLATAGVLAFAFDVELAGTPAMLAAIGAVYAVLGAVTIQRLRARGELIEQLRPRYGDLAVGAAIGALLYAVAMAGHMALSRWSSAYVGWIMRIYFQVGDPDGEGQVLVGACIFLIAALEEISWRGLVLRELEDPLGSSRAWIVTTLLYGAAHIPTVFLLAVPRAGLNPLLVVAALGCGLVWGRVAIRAERLAPAIFAHAFFSWAIVEFPIWRP